MKNDALLFIIGAAVMNIFAIGMPDDVALVHVLTVRCSVNPGGKKTQRHLAAMSPSVSSHGDALPAN